MTEDEATAVAALTAARIAAWSLRMPAPAGAVDAWQAAQREVYRLVHTLEAIIGELDD